MNSASYSSTSFSPGQLISIFGDGLALDTRIATTENNQLPAALGSTAVLVDNTPLPLLMISPGQVNAILPKAWSGSSMQIRVMVDGLVSNTVTIPISAGAPALFTADASGKGSGAIVNQDGTINSAFQPAPAGTIVSLYGTGAGTIAPQLDSGYLNLSAPFGSITGTVTASVAGQSAEVLYSGGAPTVVSGAFQMNIRIPAGTAKGAVPVDVSIGSVPANEVTVWVR